MKAACCRRLWLRMSNYFRDLITPRSVEGAHPHNAVGSRLGRGVEGVAPKPLDINKRKVFTIWCKYLIYNLRETLPWPGRRGWNVGTCLNVIADVDDYI